MCFKESKNQQSWLPFGNSSQKGGVFMHVDRGRFFVFVDRGRFRLYLGDSWCIHFFLAHDVFVLLVVYVRGRHLCFVFIIFIVSWFTYGTVDYWFRSMRLFVMYFFCFVKSRIYFFYLYFPHMRLYVCWVFQEYTGLFNHAAVYTGNW